MRPWNPHAQTFHGEPITGFVPTGIRVHGPPMTPQQAAFANAAFTAFCSQVRLSEVPNPTAHGHLMDGSRYHIAVTGNTALMTVWTAQSEPQEINSGCGILIEVVGHPQRYLLQHDGGVGAPRNGWRVVLVDWLLDKAADDQLVPTAPAYPVSSWHSVTGKEYLVAGRDDDCRLGQAVSNGVGPVRGGGRETLRKVVIGGQKMFCHSFRTGSDILGTSVGVKTYPAFPLALDSGQAFPVYLDSSTDIVIRTAESSGGKYENIDSINLSNDGRKALVCLREYLTDPDIPPVSPGSWTSFRGGLIADTFFGSNPTPLVEIVRVPSGNPWRSHKAEEYVLGQTAWTKVADAVTLSVGACTPPLIEYKETYSTPVVEFRNYMAFDLISAPSYWHYQSTPCTWVNGPGDARGNALVYSGSGDQTYREWNEVEAYGLNSKEGLVAWYNRDGTKSVLARGRYTKSDRQISGTVDDKAWANLYCADTGWVSWSTTSKETRTRTLHTDTNVVDKEWFDLGGDRFYTNDYEFQMVRNQSWDHSDDSSLGDRRVLTNASGDLYMKVIAKRRTLLLWDEMLDALCYTEISYEYEVSAFASSTYDSDRLPHEIASGATGILPDFAIPTPVLVIECRGARITFSTLHEGTDHEVRRSMRAINPYSMAFEQDVTSEGDRSARALAASRMVSGGNQFGTVPPLPLSEETVGELLDKGEDRRTSPLLGSLSLGRSAGMDANPANVVVHYAKDPKTGAAVLWLVAGKPELAPTLPAAFAIDQAGIKQLSTVLPGVAASEIYDIGAA